MSYQYDYFVSYAREDNGVGLVGEFVDRLVDSPDFEPLLGAKARVFFDAKPVRDRVDWESRIRRGVDVGERFLSP